MKLKSPLKWHGGKHYLARWIISKFPPRDTYSHYLEPYAGGLSVLFAHDPAGKSESVNDLNSELSNFWHVLANTPDRMLRILWGTPMSQQVWMESGAQKYADMDSVRRATAFFIRYRQSRQGLGKDYATPTKRIRRGMNENVSAWLSAVEGLPEAHKRLMFVEIRNMDALAFMRLYDHESALFYLDPPYVHETRVTTKDYEHEMTLHDHEMLLDYLTGIKGKFLLSGYRNPMYDSYAQAQGWNRHDLEIDNKASSKSEKPVKVESLWCNY